MIKPSDVLGSSIGGLSTGFIIPSKSIHLDAGVMFWPLLDSKYITIYITHCHQDHIANFNNLCINYLLAKTQIAIISHPEIIRYLKDSFEKSIQYYKVINNIIWLDHYDYILEHTCLSVGFKIDNFVYLGDTILCDSVIKACHDADV